jgi:hypothetical protein
MGDEMQAGSGSEARTEARAHLGTYFSESGFYTPKMMPRGRLVAEVVDCRGGGFGSDYPEASGHLDPGVAVRLHDTCAALYDGRLSVVEADNAWDEWESLLYWFADAYGLNSLSEFLTIADPGTPKGRAPAEPLGPLEREALSPATDWLQFYILSYAHGDADDDFSDDTVTWAELAVDTDRETGGGDTPRSEEERREDEELLQSTSEYIDSLLMEYRVVDVAQ